jgi:alkanesulfonate monooxygenase SsuD/methylene tetrahydromethanopterin reductase-like flavin-dependent oxidoreductase (luciferase family)
MKFGITPTPYFWDGFQKFTEWCVKVEEMEFDAILVPDHYQFPVPHFTPIVYLKLGQLYHMFLLRQAKLGLVALLALFLDIFQAN